jgi:hypothetical protein
MIYELSHKKAEMRCFLAQVIEVTKQYDMVLRSAHGHVEQARAVLLKACGSEEKTERHSKRVRKVDHHCLFLITLEAMDSSGDACGAGTQALNEKGLDQASLRGVRCDDTYCVVGLACRREVTGFGKTKDHFLDQHGVENVIAGVCPGAKRRPWVKRRGIHVEEWSRPQWKIFAREQVWGGVKWVIVIEQLVNYSADRFLHPILGSEFDKMRRVLVLYEGLGNARNLEDIALEPLFGKWLPGLDDWRELPKVTRDGDRLSCQSCHIIDERRHEHGGFVDNDHVELTQWVLAKVRAVNRSCKNFAAGKHVLLNLGESTLDDIDALSNLAKSRAQQVELALNLGLRGKPRRFQ